MKKDIGEIGCGAHTLHNCVHGGYDTPETEAEKLAAKIYKCSHLHSKCY
jgi:hypothetical protein